MNDFRKRMLPVAAIGVLAVIGSLINSQQAIAQGQAQGGPTVTIDKAQLPLPVQVTNTVPVTLISPAPRQSVTCTVTFDGGGGSFSPFSGLEITFAQANQVKCPTGTSAIDVKRIIYDPDNRFTEKLAGYRSLLGFASTSLDRDPNATILGLFTEGSPEKTFTEPIRLDVTTVPGVSIKSSCFSVCKCDLWRRYRLFHRRACAVTLRLDKQPARPIARGKKCGRVPEDECGAWGRQVALVRLLPFEAGRIAKRR
jgi:hypothetical protein